MESKIKWLFVALSFFFFLTDFFILVRYRRYGSQRTGLKIFILEKYFYLGAAIRRFFHVSSKRYKKRLRLLSELFDETEAVNTAISMTNAPFTYFALALPLVTVVASLGGDRLYISLMLLLVVFMCVYPDLWLHMRVKEKNEAILSQFSGMVLKMYMLVRIGVPSSVAFEKIAASSTGFLYEEMLKIVNDVSTGISYGDALEAFRARCSCKEVRKFISAYKQNLTLGGADFPVLLNEMAENAFSTRKERAKLKGNMASQKLLFPTMMMFVGVLIMVIVPSFENIFS